MKYFKKMIGKLCYLSPMNLEDAEQYTKWLNDMDVTKYLTLRSLNITTEFEENMLKALSQNHNYAIVDIRNDKLLGNCGFVSIDNLNNTGEVGIFIGNKEYWGKGYGTEALKLLILYGINILNLRNILIQVYSYNTRALKSYEKVGFKKIGTRRKAILYNRKAYDIIFLDLLAEEFIEDAS